MTYISDVAEYLICKVCGWKYNPKIDAQKNSLMQPRYEIGTDGEWHYFCPVCGNLLLIKF